MCQYTETGRVSELAVTRGPRGAGLRGAGLRGAAVDSQTRRAFFMYTHAPEFFAREMRAAPYGASPQEGGVDWVRDARWACPPADRRQQRSDVRRPDGACGTDVAPSRVALEVKGPTPGGRHQSWMALWVQVPRPCEEPRNAGQPPEHEKAARGGVECISN